jgi:hypothetical protein
MVRTARVGAYEQLLVPHPLRKNALLDKTGRAFFHFSGKIRLPY